MEARVEENVKQWISSGYKNDARRKFDMKKVL